MQNFPPHGFYGIFFQKVNLILITNNTGSTFV